MIGSTLSRMGAAEKLSIPQLQRAIQDGTVPAYIGVPLLQDKMKQQQEAKAMAAGQVGKQPTVADQVMQQATQEEQQEAIARQQAAMQRGGVDQLPIAEPVTMAGGGIIAFAAGGDAEDQSYEDYLQDVEDAEDDAQQARFMSLLGAKGEGASMGYGDVTGSKLKADRSKPASTGHKYEDTVLKYAEKYGVDPKLALHVLNKETGGMKNPEAARSKAGAMGIMQLMPETAKMLGVKDPLDPEQSGEGGVRYLAMLGRQFGNDPRLVAAAYNAGPGNVRKYGGVPPFAETRGYVKGLSGGGIASFDKGGKTSVDPVTGEVYTAEPSAVSEWLQPGENVGISDWFSAQGAKARGFNPSTAEAIEQNPDVQAYYKQYGSQLLGSPDLATFQKDPRAYVKGKQEEYAKAHPAKTEETTTSKPPSVVTDKTAVSKDGQGNQGSSDQGLSGQEKPKSYFEQVKEELLQARQERAANREQDKWMGLLTAGLGMMGGTSPYAGANIGQGAMAGVSQYGALRKQAAAEEAADLKNILLAQKYQEQGELASAQQKATEAYHRQQLGLTASGQASSDLARKQTAFDQYKKEGEASIEKQYGSLLMPEAKLALQKFQTSPEFIAARNAAFPDLPKMTASATMPTQGTPGWSATVK